MSDKKGGFFRKKKLNFSMVSNSIIQDETISLKAKGLYALIQSYITRDDFTLYKWYLQSKCREGNDAFDGAWRELKKTGYLKQYKMNSVNGFYYEYELLDSPDTDSPDMENPCLGNPHLESPDLGNQGCNNNIIDNNIVVNNIDSIISIEDVMDQIGYAAFNPSDMLRAKEIARLITDVMNANDNKTIRIDRDNLQSSVVKKRFSELDHFHVGYVLDCLSENETKISNMKSYLLTALYNAPSTMNLYYQNKVNNYKRENENN